MHTPAPWKWIAFGQTVSVSNTETSKLICVINPYGFRELGIPSEIDEANAQLIAIAPEMRDLLANLVSAYDTRNITAFNRFMNQAREIAANHQPKGANTKSTQ